MKNIKLVIMLISCLVLSEIVYCQQNHPSTTLTSADYLRKSKNQKAAGWLILGGGILTTTVGIGIFLGKGALGAETGDLIIPAIGLGMTFGSIPFFTSSRKNARISATLSLETQPVFIPQQRPVILSNPPALTIKIGIR